MSVNNRDEGSKAWSGEPIGWLLLAALFVLVIFCWVSIQAFTFNGLSSPLFLALAAILLFPVIILKVQVGRRSLILYLLWAGWVVFVDAISGDFLPAFARDAHWLIFPLLINSISELVKLQPMTPRIFRLSAAVSVFLILVSYLLSANVVVDWSHPPLFGNIRHFGMTMGFFVVILSGRGDADKYEKIFIGTSRVIGLAMLLWSGSRAPVLGWVAAGAIFIRLRTNAEVPVLLATELLAATALALLFDPGDSGSVGLLSMFIRSAHSSSLDELSAGRGALWSNTIKALLEHERWITGAGGNGFIRLGLSEIGPIFHPHNIFLQLLTDWGVVGLILFSVFILGSGLIRTSYFPHATEALAMIGFVLVSGQFDASTYHLEHLVYFSIPLGMLLATGKQDPTPISIKWLAVMGIAAFSLLHVYLIDYRINWNTLKHAPIQRGP